MAVGLSAPIDLLPVPGVRLGTAAAGIKHADRDDLLLLEIAEGAQTAAVFTRNAFSAAPVLVAREHLSCASPRYLLVNSGNANAGTGSRGLADSRTCCADVAARCGCRVEEVLPFSTGVIGEPLPVARISEAVPGAMGALAADGWLEAATAIMTTDTLPKASSRRFELGDAEAVVTGIAKGAGMIRPDMATMLAFIATDASVDPRALESCLREAVETSFNRITVDGDTSTNDACVLVATGAGRCDPVTADDTGHYASLMDAISGVCSDLARAIVRDGEGATRFITIRVSGGRDVAECLRVAYTIAHSPLVKTACFAGDPNWGRILAAVGRAEVEALDVGGVDIHLDDVCIVRGGERSATYTEAQGSEVMAGDEYTISVALGRGHAAARVWTTDLSYDYVRINAEYRT